MTIAGELGKHSLGYSTTYKFGGALSNCKRKAKAFGSKNKVKVIGL